MLSKFIKVTKGTAGFIFSRKNANALRMAGAFLVDLVTIAINVAAPAVIAYEYERKNSDASEKAPTSDYLLYGAGGALFVAQLLPKIRNMFLNPVRANVQKELTLAMVEKSFELELNHQLTERTGEFAQALSKNYSSVDKAIPSFFGEILPTGVEIISMSMYLAIHFGQSGGIGLIELGVFTIYAGVAVMLEQNAQDVRTACVKGSYRGYGDVIAAIGNYIPAHLFGNVRYEIEKVDASLITSERLFSAMHRKDDINALILSIINAAGCVGALAFAAVLPPSGRFKLADFVLAVYYLTRSNTLLSTLAPAISSFSTAIADAEKVVDFLAKRSQVTDLGDPLLFELDDAPEIEFRNVSFRYGERDILRNVSFTVRAGEKFAIVGPTGAGKTTLLNLLLRFYRLQDGKILINGIDIAHVTMMALRKPIAVIGQSSSLLNDTILANIQYGDLAAPPEYIQEAAQMAELDTTRLQENAGQGGGKLSGGEQKRATIARGMLKGQGGPIIVLDEPTSALDAKTELAVQLNLDQLTAGSTTLVVTHSLSTITNANNIIYLQDGAIAESGTFEHLMSLKGAFYEQYSVQCRELGVDPDSVVPLLPRRASEEPGASASHSVARNNQSFWQRRKVREAAATSVNILGSINEPTTPYKMV